jgi:hypothetical protein
MTHTRRTGALRCRSSEICSFRDGAVARPCQRMSAPRTHRSRGEAHAMQPRGPERLGTEICMRASPLAARSHPPPNCTLECVNAFVRYWPSPSHGPFVARPKASAQHMCMQGQGRRPHSRAALPCTRRLYPLSHCRVVVLLPVCAHARCQPDRCVCVSAVLTWARLASTGVKTYAPHGLPGAVTPLDHALIVGGPAQRRSGAQGTTLPRDAALRTQEETCRRRCPCGRAGPLAARGMRRAQSRRHRLRGPISAHGVRRN